MGPRPDGRGKERQGTMARAMRGVNGAAARRPRKGRGAGRWGAQSRASMGPRPDGRGKAPAAAPSSIGSCVNGAAARRPRKARCRRCEHDEHDASMGPRPDGRGKRRRAVELVGFWERQWGRGQTAAESYRTAGRPAFQTRASMGPRPDGRGKTARHSRELMAGRVNGAAARRPRKV